MKYIQTNNKDWMDGWYESCADTVLEMYADGISADNIGRLFGFGGAKPVKRILQAHDIGLRPRAYYTQGQNNPAWNGGRRIDGDGYVLMYAPSHPYASCHGTVREHRLVMEKHLGRYLLPTEVVDHINGIKDDNRIENLRLFASNAEHLASTLKGRCPKWSEDGKRRLDEVRLQARMRSLSRRDAVQSQ